MIIGLIAIFIYTAVALYATLYPFIFRSFTVPGFLDNLALLFSFKAIRVTEFDILANLLLFGLLGVLWGIFFGKRRPVLAFFFAVIYGLFLSILVEAAQADIPSRFSSLVDVAVDTVAVGAGFIAIILLKWTGAINVMKGIFSYIKKEGSRRVREMRVSVIFWIFLLATLFVIFREGFHPFSAQVNIAMLKYKLARIEWIPFASYMQKYNISTLEDAVRKIMIYFVLGSEIFYFIRKKFFNKKFIPLFAAMGTFFIATCIETGQIFLPGRYVTVTDLLIAFGAGLFGALTVKTLFFQPLVPEDEEEAAFFPLTEAVRGQYNYTKRSDNMDQKLFSRFTILCALISVVAGVSILFLGYDAGPPIFKIAFGVGFIFLAFVIFLIGEIYTRIFQVTSEIIKGSEAQQRLLMDLRDGTKSFFLEKRRSHRAEMGEGISVKVQAKDVDVLSRTLDISGEGALIRTVHEFSAGNEVTLGIYLPLYARPITVKAQVVRVTPRPDVDPAGFDVGVEFKSISSEDREKLQETITRTIRSQE